MHANLHKVVPVKIERPMHMSDFFIYASRKLVNKAAIAMNGDIGKYLLVYYKKYIEIIKYFALVRLEPETLWLASRRPCGVLTITPQGL